MRYIYWGANNSGKFQTFILFRASKKSIVWFTHNFEYGRLIKYNNSLEYEYEYYQEENSNIIKREESIRNDDVDMNDFIHKVVKDIHQKHVWTWSREFSNPRIRLSSNIKYQKIRSWDSIINDWENCDLLIAPFPLIGLECSGMRISLPATYHSISDISLQYVRNSRNIIPYKENTLDSIISKLILFNTKVYNIKSMRITGKPTSFKDVFDAYNKHKEMVWMHVDHILNEQKAIEDRLIQLDIPYERFNLDNDDYSIFNCDEVSFDRDVQKVEWDLKLKDIAEEYITLRGL